MYALRQERSVSSVRYLFRTKLKYAPITRARVGITDPSYVEPGVAENLNRPQGEILVREKPHAGSSGNIFSEWSNSLA